MRKCLVLGRGMTILSILIKISDKKQFRNQFKKNSNSKNKTENYLILKFNLKFKNQGDEEEK